MPCLWQAGKVHRLGLLPGDDRGRAWAVNERDQVIGFTQNRGADRGEHGFVWENGTLTALPTLGGRLSLPVALNDRGRIVGWATNKAGQGHAVLWTLRSG